MLYYTVGQWYALAYMMLCGVIMGAIYEAFRMMRHLTMAGRALSAVLDAVMCVLLALVMAIILNGPARIMRAGAARALCLARRVRIRLRDIALFKHILK